ncbi:Malate-2H(+)/Na(+)-lactate antiporter [Rubripirellula obstinata]|uniref:Malate-2H(+)/Na(+)-lactate antiporter n=1 Tax=Rubripirellula obstinata TaxID=406547 RepID=A0A5B1CGF2_9BACT|nr:Na+/H+ antiporter NhaC family protein [Rubripirellula obstinata]KAA1260268.1 Malate-2H(+)/Na(+)-lactate antiporter [Rubripirellula obstinata]
MTSGAESLLPPLVAIVLAILFRRVVLPLAAGVFVGAVLIAWKIDLAWHGSLTVFYDEIYEAVFSSSHLQALAFSLLLGAMVGVLESGRSMHSLIRIFSRRIRSRQGGQTLIAASGLAIFFDDYANTLLVGGTMRSSADRYGISREKLAYLVDSTAAPIAGLSVVSTWAAIEISYMADGLRAAGITESSAAFEMFLQSIPYRFYPWVALATVFMIAISGRDFGPMRIAEQKASRGHRESELNSVGSNPVAEEDTNDYPQRRLWIAAVLPVAFCLIAVAVVLVQTGLQAINSTATSQELSATSEVSRLQWFSDVLGNGDSYLALIAGGVVGLATAILLHFLIAKMSVKRLGLASAKGAAQMMPAMLILWFAWALSSMTEPDRLDTGGYLSALLSDRIATEMLPTVVFLLAGAMAFSTGTSWGTMGILTPLSVSLAIKLDPVGGAGGAIALSTCGAVLAGAIFGDHCSPISDTTVLSSRASECDHLAHVKTQLPYALTVALVCIFAGTIPTAFGISPWLCLLTQVLLMALVLWRFGQRPDDLPLS